jgi:class 3 adenylate cyclase
MWLDRALSILFPTLPYQGAPWYPLWEAKERESFQKIAKVLFPLIGFAYIAHFIFFDRLMGLEPIDFWLKFRVSMATLAFATAAFYLVPSLKSIRYYKIPAVIAGFVFCYFQARVLVWYQDTLYFYAFAFVIVATLILRVGVAQSLSYALINIAFQWHSFVEAGLQPPLLASAIAITLIFIVYARSGYAAELRYFHANQQNIENQRRIIELNIEFSDRIRAFLPKEISLRLGRYIEQQHMTILQAIEEVLRPRRKRIACIYTDIRGFTRSTQGLGEAFLDEGVIPNVRECTHAIERNGGIPRKIGDLVFAYFDQPDARANILQCFGAALDVIDANNQFNIGRDEKGQIVRYVLMASGDATVGNLGGFDSSIEITALGNPVNFLARLDEATKHPAIRKLVTSNHIVMDDQTAAELQALIPEFSPRCLSLRKVGIEIRDFEDIDSIWLYKAESRSDLPSILEVARYHGSDVGDTSGAVQSIRP